MVVQSEKTSTEHAPPERGETATFSKLARTSLVLTQRMWLTPPRAVAHRDVDAADCVIFCNVWTGPGGQTNNPRVDFDADADVDEDDLAAFNVRSLTPCSCD